MIVMNLWMKNEKLIILLYIYLLNKYEVKNEVVVYDNDVFEFFFV